MPGPDVERAVALLQDATGESYELVGLLSGGETGAHEVRRRPVESGSSSNGRRIPTRKRCAARAWNWRNACGPRRAGPSRQRMVEAPGCLLVLQSFMDGHPICKLTPVIGGRVAPAARPAAGARGGWRRSPLGAAPDPDPG